jgi:predicted sulfurtransferase
MAEKEHYPKALVDYDDFKNLVSELEKQREKNLVSLDVFLKMAKEENTVILDSRSDFRFNRKHLKGAIYLHFTDFTQENL